MKKQENKFYLSGSWKPLAMTFNASEFKAEMQKLTRREKEKAKAEHRAMPPLSEKEIADFEASGINGIHSHNWNMDGDRVVYFLDKGYLFFSYIIDFFYMSPPQVDGSPDYMGCIDVIREKFMSREGPFLLCAGLEVSCPFSGKEFPFPDKPISKKEACEYFLDYLRYQNGCGCLDIYLKYCEEKNVPIKELNLMIGSHPQWHHLSADLGAECLFSEGNCGLQNDQLRTAFIRGVAKQYSRKWFMYWSSWGGVDRQTTTYDENGKLKTGFTPSLALRQWIGSFYSGADICGGPENPQLQCFYYDKNNKQHATEYGKNLKKFSDFAFKRHPERGKPYVPVAIMLDYYHGWEPDKHRVWGGAFPYTRNEQMIENFFAEVFPGNDRSYKITSTEWNPKNNHYPWSCQQELFEMQEKGAFDHRIYEKGLRTDSPWGNSFDVVMDNCPIEVLNTYKVIIVLGELKITGKLREKLLAYVEQGGTLVLNSNHVEKDDLQLTGLEFQGYREMLWETMCNQCGKLYRHSVGEVELARPVTAEVLVKAVGGYRWGVPDAKRIEGYDGADPVAVSNKIGKGKVITTLIPYMQSASGEPMHSACCDLIDHIIQSVQPVKISGPAIEYMINEIPFGLIVTLINNGPDFWRKEPCQTWKGKISIPNSATQEITVKELWTDQDVDIEKDDNTTFFSPEIPPFSFGIFEISGDFNTIKNPESIL